MKHRGICLGFNIPRAELQKVKYEADRLLAELDHEPDPAKISQDLQPQLLCTKSSGWIYEDEYRRFVPLADAMPEGQLYFVPFGPSMNLAEVVLGPLCDMDVTSVRQLVSSRYPAALTYKSRLAFKSFKVVPEEGTVP